ncbi:hypothetical protein C8R43DRAFT_348652 [Mycena crocata]|nr:hypothetical protein C8R43DRAFT_348652 [Mycena crocata]
MRVHGHSSSAIHIPSSPSRSLQPSPTRKRNSWGSYTSNNMDDPFNEQADPWRAAASASLRYGTPPADTDASSSLAGPSSAAASLYDNEDSDVQHLTPGPSDTRRMTLRYSTSPSPLKKTSTAIKHVSQNLRRASIRVVNMGAGRERLPDDKGSLSPDDEDTLPDLALGAPLPLRGRTLGFLGPTNGLRLACFNVLVYPWTEPIILLLIILNAVILAIQSSRTLTLANPPLIITGYFHAWEDYALVSLFVVFTLEAFARIIVSGLLFDPERSASFAFRTAFALPPAPGSEKFSSTGNVGSTPATSSVGANDTLSLPFRLSIAHTTTQTRRNAPYLRHSYSRIDAIAIVAFWVSFLLATEALEIQSGMQCVCSSLRAIVDYELARCRDCSLGSLVACAEWLWE